MKKFVIFVAFLLLSLQVAYAEHGEEGTTEAEVHADADVTAKPLAVNARLGVDAKVARERYMNMKEDYGKARDRYAEIKQDYIRKTNGTRVDVRINASFEDQKTLLLAFSERVIAHLESLKAIADSNNRTEVSTNLQTYIDAIADIKVDIQNATTVEQLKSAAQELRRMWKSAQEAVARRHGLIFVNKLENLIDRFENAVEKIDSRLSNLSDKGYNVSDADTKVDEILDLLAQAKVKVGEAEAEFRLVTGAPGNDEHWRKGHALLKEANELLRQAHQKLMDFLKDIRNSVKKELHEVQKEQRIEIRDRIKAKLNASVEVD